MSEYKLVVVGELFLLIVIVIRTLIAGDGGVGKSALTIQLIQNQFVVRRLQSLFGFEDVHFRLNMIRQSKTVSILCRLAGQ